VNAVRVLSNAHAPINQQKSHLSMLHKAHQFDQLPA